MKERILTGERPTGNLHLGHYFGALENRVKLQDSYDTFIIIADVQALTDNFNNPEKVSKNIMSVALDNLSVGIDPDKSTLFIQSMIPQIAELTVFYSNLVSVSRLMRNPTVKTEIKQKEALFKKSVPYGFLGYPVSQAADITVFQANLVPVGDDQLPQIEQTKEIVHKFNKIYGDTLVEPEVLLSNFPRIKGLDGSSKMGKSLDNAIYLCDDDKTINDKVRSALTDTGKIYLKSKGNPDNCMVHYYHKIIGGDTEQISRECTSGCRGCVQCKKELTAKMIEFLSPFREKREFYEKRKDYVMDVLREGTKKAERIAEETLYQVKEKLMLNYFKD